MEVAKANQAGITAMHRQNLPCADTEKKLGIQGPTEVAGAIITTAQLIGASPARAIEITRL